MLVVVSGGQAGNAPGASSFQFTVQPEILTADQKGLAMAVFTAASGSGQGSATHVKITFDLPSGFEGGLTGTSAGCTGPDQDNAFTCEIGTVNAGVKVKRFLVFDNGTAPVSGTAYPIKGCVSLDNGSGGKKGGGAIETCADNTITDETTIVAGGSTSRAGNCGTGDVSTPLASSDTNLVSTSVSGDASASLGLPCTWAFVGEKDVTDSELVVPQVSFMGFPQTDPGSPVTWTIDIYSRPSGPFSDLDVLVDLDYTVGSPDFVGFEPDACVNGELPEGEDVCLLSFDKIGPGARATLLIEGTGGDPGFGVG